VTDLERLAVTVLGLMVAVNLCFPRRAAEWMPRAGDAAGTSE
jgi:hypothetical protein